MVAAWPYSTLAGCDGMSSSRQSGESAFLLIKDGWASILRCFYMFETRVSRSRRFIRRILSKFWSLFFKDVSHQVYVFVNQVSFHLAKPNFSLTESRPDCNQNDQGRVMCSTTRTVEFCKVCFSLSYYENPNIFCYLLVAAINRKRLVLSDGTTFGKEQPIRF